MNMRRLRDYAAHGAHIHVFAMGEGGPAAELHVIEDKESAMARQGAGGVHHVAFRTPDETQYHAWTQRLTELGAQQRRDRPVSIFAVFYFREPNGILFEIATDGPGLRPTSRWRRSAKSWRCRRSWKPAARRSRRD